MAADFFANWGVPNTFQNLNVSSPAPDATVHPSGLCSKIKSKPKKTFSPYYHNTTIINPNQLITSENFIHTWAMNKTREVCPMSSAILTIDGYFQSVNWFWVNPWEHSNSLSFLFHSNEHTWEPVSTELRQAPVWVFQNLMHWSLSPPPEASRLLWNGHQARALTAPCGPQSSAPTGSGSGLQLMSPSTDPRCGADCQCLHWPAAGLSQATWAHRPPECVPGKSGRHDTGSTHHCWLSCHPYRQLLGCYYSRLETQLEIGVPLSKFSASRNCNKKNVK